ncbi:hypothetical protein TNCV_2588921 [Trichonephila clavipes]|nr:hypothetical protein TNCV_2588921 [Trichonephila clavipes]
MADNCKQNEKQRILTKKNKKQQQQNKKGTQVHSIVSKSYILFLASQYLLRMSTEMSVRQRARGMASISSLASHNLQRELWAMPIMFRCMDMQSWPVAIRKSAPAQFRGHFGI